MANFLKKNAVLILIVLFSIGIRLINLERFGLWGGEIHQIFHSGRPIEQIPLAFRSNTAHPPLWFLLTTWLVSAGATILTLRLPSVVVGLLSIIAMYLFTRRFFSKNWALLATWLFAILPESLRWSQTARMYAAYILLSLLVFIFAFDMLDVQKKHAWKWFSIAVLLNLFNQYFAIIPTVVCGLFILIEIIQRWRAPEANLKPSDEGKLLPESEGISAGALAERLGYAVATIFITYFPWAWIVARYNFVDRQLSREEGSSVSILTSDTFRRLFEDLIGGGANWFLTVLLTLLLVGGYALIAKNRRGSLALFLALNLILPLLFLIVFDPRRFHGRYIIFMLPLLIVVLIAGVEFLYTLLQRLQAKTNAHRASAQSFVAFVILIMSAQYLYADVLFLNADEHYFYNSKSDPRIWRRRGDWSVIQAQFKSPSIFLVGRTEYTNVVNETATMLYITDDLAQGSLNVDWSAVSSLDLWSIYQVYSDNNRVIDLDDPVCGIPLGEEVVSGPNQRFYRVQLAVNSYEQLQINGDFEADINLNPGPADLSTSGWVIRGGGKKFVDVVPAPDGESGSALAVLYADDTQGRVGKVTLASPIVSVEPAELLLASAQVQFPVLLYHETTPFLAFEFYDAEGNSLSPRECPAFNSNLPYDRFAPGSWQAVYFRAIVPPGASHARVLLVFPLNQITDHNIYVDDILLERLSVTPQIEPGP